VRKSAKNQRQDSQHPGREPNSATPKYGLHIRSASHLNTFQLHKTRMYVHSYKISCSQRSVHKAMERNEPRDNKGVGG